jgi:DNA-binding NarL/FixJ family response regulator
LGNGVVPYFAGARVQGILIASDVRLYSEGLRQFLGAQPGFRVLAIADSASAALRAVETDLPDLVLLDQALPGSLETLRGIRRLHPGSRVIALGLQDQEEAILMWAEAGAAGFVPRDASLDELLETIGSALRDELLCSPRVAASLLRRLACRASAGPAHPPRAPLTPREAMIVSLIDEGLSNKEIAVRLGIEVATVKNHVHNLLEKLRVHRRAEAAARLRGKDPRRPTPQQSFRIPD